MTNLWDGCTRALLYPVQFERDPLTGVDRVLEVVVRNRVLGLAPARYLELTPEGKRAAGRCRARA